MKKTIVMLTIAGVVLTPVFVFASGKEMGGKMKGHGMMGMMGGKASMVASNDGGVFVMSGNKLYKYDKDLNLVKEVELKASEGMGKMCPMCAMKMGQKEMPEGDAPADEAPASEEDHQAHH